ncbi:MAG: aminopeptidase N [Mycobacteriales bacterium]
MHNLTRAEAQRRAELLEVQRYAVELDLTTGDETFRSVTEIRFRCHQTGADSYAELLAPTVHSIVFNGEELDPAAVLDGDRVALRGLAASNILTVVADCAYSRTGEGLHRFVDPADDEVYLYSQAFLYDAHRIFACFDQPDLKAVFELSVTAPPEWLVVSNAAVAELAGGRWRFAPTPSISTYLTALAAGPYAAVHDRHGDIDLGVYCRRSLAEHLDAAEILELTKASFDHYQRVFDYPYAFAKYDQLFVPEFNAGAMENPGAVTIRDEYVFRSKVTDAAREQRADTIAHEMAHMWFGDLVTMRWWDDLWLNESFATYMSHLTVSEVTRFTNAWTTFCNSWKGYGYRADQLPSTHPISADVVDTDSALLNFDGISYGKGAAVLKQLVAWVGREEFLAGVRAYFRDHEFANTTLADLLAALEKASGRDLAAWAAAWLRTAGVNTLRPAVQVSAGAYTYVAVEQEAPVEHPTLRPHRVGIGLYDLSTEGLVRRQRLEIDIDGGRTEVSELAGVRQPDLLLVNDDDLTYAKIRLDERSLATVMEHAGEIRESLPRTLCWNAAWDMTRDAELPARDYVRLVVAGVAAEDDIGVAQSLLANARSAAIFYADPAYRPELLRSLAELSRRRMSAAEPGSDVQLASARAFTLAATTGDEAVAVQAMLDGTAVPAGLSIDADLRWHLLLRLVDLGAAGDSEIDAELDRDRTATGEQQAAAARAGRPEAAAKAAAWAALVDSNALSNRLVTSTAGGFWRSEQLALCRPYVDRYFAALAQIWRTRTPEIARQLTTLLYPSLLVEPATLARTDVHLSTADLPTGLRRLLGEHRDDVARALRARACDSAATPAR